MPPRAPIHPAIAEAVDDARRGTMAAGAFPSPEAYAAAQAYCEARARRLALPLFLAALPFVGFFALVARYSVHLTMVGVLVAFAVLVALVGFAVLGSRLFRVTPRELAILSPALDLTRVQRAYLDARLLLESHPSFDPEGELERGLAGLVDEESRLLALRAGEEIRMGGAGAIVRERDDLRTRLSATDDPVVRDSLAHGLRTCERRLAAAQELLNAEERIDAHLEMVAQTAADVRDGLRRLAAAGRTEFPVDADSLRETLAGVQSHAAALEAAVAEVRAL